MQEDQSFHIPKEGLKGLNTYGRADITAALFVFVLSLPFCLSVAFGAQLSITSGLITAIVGGLLISFLGGATMAVRMPTIGLIPIIIWGIHHLGSGYSDIGFKHWLAVLVLAGVLQLLLGLFRAGDLLGLVPDTVIYGILATIGIDIIIRQAHYLIGAIPQADETLGLILELPSSLIYQIKPDIALISGVCLFILFISTSLRSRYESILPSPMFVLFVGASMAIYMGVANKYGQEYLITVPSNWDEVFIFPNFNRIQSWEAIEVAMVVALFSSLESLLNVKGIEALDFYRRKVKINRELMALGLGNIFCGLLGGMPMASSMIQSAANINSGAKTRWSNFFAAIYLSLFFVFASFWLSYVPWAVFSAILIYICYGLISPKLMRDIHQIGLDQSLIFGVTVIASLAGGILIGLLAGWLCSLGVSLFLGASLKSLFKAKVKVVNYGNKRTKIMVRSSAVASNYLSIRRQISKIPSGNQVYLDFSKSKVVDFSFMELVYHHPYNYNNTEGNMEVQGIEDHKTISDHPISTRVLPDKKPRMVLEDITRFSERQLDVLAAASVNNVKLRPNLTYDGHKLQGFSFALGYDIKYRENKFSKPLRFEQFNKATRLEFSDIFLSRGLRMSELNRNMSIMMIQDIQIRVPNFTLNKEGILDKMLQSLGYSDIDFDEYPLFSEHFLLQGKDELDIREFFSPSLIEFFENNQDFSVESYNGNILIHRGMHLMTRIEIEDAIWFAESLLKVIYQELSPESKKELVPQLL